MLLNMKSLLMLAILGIGFSAQAGNMTNLTAGHYKLISGSKKVCVPFKIKKKDLTSKNIYLGNNQLFLTENAQSSVKSDINANCEFVDKSTRTDSGSETTLTMVNKEFCNGQIRSETTSVATIRAKEITLTIQTPGAKSEVCKFSSIK